MELRDADRPGQPAFSQPGAVAEARGRCLVVVGSRRDAVHLFPLVLALRATGRIDPFVVLAGSHGELTEPILTMAGVVVDADIRTGLAGRTANQVIATTVTRFDDLLSGMRRCTRWPAPSATVVHGSSTAALAAALASAGSQIPVIHIESDSGAALAGRPEGSALPGDFNGRMLARLATLSVAPTMAELDRLASEGVPTDEVCVTGSTAVDAFRWAADRHHEWHDPALAAADATGGPIVLVNVRHAGPTGSDLAGLAGAVAEIATSRPDVTVVVPLHCAPQVRAALLPALLGLPNVLVVKPLRYGVFARLVARATLAISDSQSLQQEAPAVGTPVLATSANTRQMGSEAGATLFVGSDPRLLAEQALRLLRDDRILDRMRHAPNPFGDGRAAQRIAQALVHVLFDGPAPAPFVREGTLSLPAQRQPDRDRRASDPTTHAYAELTALAHRTRGSLRPVRRGQQDR